jgi:hypothetical protein
MNMNAQVSAFLRMVVLTAAFCLQLMANPASAQDTKTKDPPPGSRVFGGLTLGVGLGLTLNTGRTQRVESAIVTQPNNIVRVTQTSDAIAGIVLESHYFFVPRRTRFFDVEPGDWGHGPFVAIQAGSGEVINAIGLGWMIGFRERSWTSGTPLYSDTASWNIGLGLRVDPKAQVLGDGIVANQPLPAGETSVRFNQVPRYGVLLVSSFSF